jgi:alkylated DNA nucleotide flippase Atl1
MPAEFRERVIAVINRLNAGEVVSYGDVAAEAGYPGAARLLRRDGVKVSNGRVAR